MAYAAPFLPHRFIKWPCPFREGFLINIAALAVYSLTCVKKIPHWNHIRATASMATSMTASPLISKPAGENNGLFISSSNISCTDGKAMLIILTNISFLSAGFS